MKKMAFIGTMVSLFLMALSANAGDYFPAECGILQWEDKNCGAPFAYNEYYLTKEFGCPPLLYFIVIKKGEGFKAKPLAVVDLYSDGKPWAVHLFGCVNDNSIDNTIKRLGDKGYIILKYQLVPNDNEEGDTVAMGRIVGLPPITTNKIACPAINMLLLE